MTEFEALFGIKANKVKKNCILMPMFPKGILDDFKAANLVRGKLYSCAHGRNFTLIHTLMGPAFVGDAVLWLKETSCRNIILFGSCGLIRQRHGLTLGSVVSPLKVYSNESFSMFLEKHSTLRVAYPDKNLFDKLVNEIGPTKVICSSMPTLKLEKRMLGISSKINIDVMDMESSACFKAASYIGLKAVALFYVVDVINDYPYYKDLELVKKEELSLVIKKSARDLCDFLANLS